MELSNYIFPALIVGFFGYRFYNFFRMKKKLPSLLENGAIIVDVRSASEYKNGSNPRSINIPFEHLNKDCQKLDKTKPIILCCASGTRSGIAVGILKKNGFKAVMNGGPWTNTIV